MNFLDFLYRFPSQVFWQWFLTLDVVIVVDQSQESTLLQCSNNSRSRLKMLHSLEAMDDIDGNGEVLVPFDFVKQKSVSQ